MAMTEVEVAEQVARCFAMDFPRRCPACGRGFASLAEWTASTDPLGPIVSIDAELERWNTDAPLGFLAFANCPCGTTLALSTERMGHGQQRLLLRWLRSEVLRTGASEAQILTRVRDRIRRGLSTHGAEPDAHRG